MFCPNFALIFARPQKCWGGARAPPPPPGPYAYAAVRSEVLLFSVAFKFIAMIIGILGNMTVIIYAILTNKEKTRDILFGRKLGTGRSSRVFNIYSNMDR